MGGDIFLAQALKFLKPKIEPGIKKGQAALKEYLESIELLEGETHCAVVSDFDADNNLILIVSAMKAKTFSRAIKIYKSEHLLNLIEQLL